MSKLTLEEAISHCLETAERLEERANIPYKVEDSELQDNACRECAADHRQLAEWLTELKEAKRLLALAVEDFKTIGEVRTVPTPMIHPKYIEYTRIIDILDLNWRHTDEALKLIGND